jgi:hypothetical protein
MVTSPNRGHPPHGPDIAETDEALTPYRVVLKGERPPATHNPLG